MTTAAGSTCTLDIGGMTCASCVRRVEKTLSRIDGVASAEVNLGTEVATISFDPQTVGLDEITAAVAKAGYTATTRNAAGATSLQRDEPGAVSTTDSAHDAQLRNLKRKWQVTLTAGLGLMGVMYLPLSLDTMDWLMPAHARPNDVANPAIAPVWRVPLRREPSCTHHTDHHRRTR